MNDENDSVENLLKSKLDALFVGINSGLSSLREVRAVYDREIAFDFNPLDLFDDCINENRISALLAYFLDPRQKHGQNDLFLRVLLEQLGAKEAIELLDRSAPVKVDFPFTTTSNRFIDIVVTIGNNEFVIGFENKVWGAVDQPEQIRDYVSELKFLSSGHYILLYLSPDGTGPAESSITEDEIKVCDQKFQILAFNNGNGFTVLTLLRQWAEICRADSVRSFIKFIEKYLKLHFQGDKTMDESTFLINYLTKHDDAARQVPALAAAFGDIKYKAQQAVYEIIQAQLKETPRHIHLSKALSNKVIGVTYDMKKLPNYIGVEFEMPDIGLPINEDPKCNNSIQANSIKKESLEQFIVAMKMKYSNLRTNAWWLGGYVRLPNYLIDDQLFIRVLEEKAPSFLESSLLKNIASNVSDYISCYIDIVEEEWPRAGLPLA